MNWLTVLWICLLAAALTVVGVVLLARWLQHREPYATVLRLPARKKLRFFRYMATDRRVPRKARLAPFLLALYLATPIDLVPDFIPVLGYIDDIGVIVLTLVLMVKLTPRETIAAVLDRVRDGDSCQARARVDRSPPPA